MKRLNKLFETIRNSSGQLKFKISKYLFVYLFLLSFINALCFTFYNIRGLKSEEYLMYYHFALSLFHLYQMIDINFWAVNFIKKSELE